MRATKFLDILTCSFFWPSLKSLGTHLAKIIVQVVVYCPKLNPAGSGEIPETHTAIFFTTAALATMMSMSSLSFSHSYVTVCRYFRLPFFFQYVVKSHCHQGLYAKSKVSETFDLGSSFFSSSESCNDIANTLVLGQTSFLPMALRALRRRGWKTGSAAPVHLGPGYK